MDFKAFYEEVLTLAGEVYVATIVARIRAVYPDMADQRAVVGKLAFSVQCSL